MERYTTKGEVKCESQKRILFMLVTGIRMNVYTSIKRYQHLWLFNHWLCSSTYSITFHGQIDRRCAVSELIHCHTRILAQIRPLHVCDAQQTPVRVPLLHLLLQQSDAPPGGQRCRLMVPRQPRRGSGADMALQHRCVVHVNSQLTHGHVHTRNIYKNKIF